MALHTPSHSFSLSYGVNLQSSLTMVIPFALAFSANPPVSVLSTGAYFLPRSFSRQRSICPFTLARSTSDLDLTEERICLFLKPTSLYGDFHHPANIAFCVTPSVNRKYAGQEFLPVVHRLRFSASA